MARLFISHSSKDKVAALAFKKWLNENVLPDEDVFLDLDSEVEGIGARWREALINDSARCEAVILLASRDAILSPKCLSELRLAEEFGKEIIVVLLDDSLLDNNAQIDRLSPFAQRQIFRVGYRGEQHEVRFDLDALSQVKDYLVKRGIAALEEIDALRQARVEVNHRAHRSLPDETAFQDADWRFIETNVAPKASVPGDDSVETTLVKSLARSRPNLVDLAALASLAVHVEPFLLRRLRLRFLPRSDASLEADLAFSELATSHAGSFELDPAFLPALRIHLARRGWVDEARDIIASTHVDLSIALQIEEEIIFLTLKKSAGWEDQVSELLARAAKAARDRQEVARWAFRAIQELPKEVQTTDGFWLLADTSSKRTGRAPPLGPIPAANYLRLANVLDTLSPRTVDVGAIRDRNDLLLTIPPTQADFLFPVPETFPVPLIIKSEEKTDELKLDTSAGTAFAKVPNISSGPITVQTLGGKIYIIPASGAAPPTKPPVFANDRDRHLFGPGPKWILSLDGGGVRSALTIAFLERIEAILQERDGKDARLGDYFDLIGGTSTGAIIASALALGYRMAQVKEFYMRLVPFAFKRQRWSIPLLQPKFDARRLHELIEPMLGTRLLSTTDLITGFCVIAKRMDTGKPWIVANNPRAPHWEPGPGTQQPSVRHFGTSQINLASLIRASTAAPHFFEPELITLTEDGTAVPMIDGGVTPHNNPSLALFQIATAKAQGLLWRTGPENLGVVNVGTGTYRSRLSYESLGFARLTKLALHSLLSLTADIENLVLATMQWMGESPAPWSINSEVGSLVGDSPPGGKMFHYVRYDVRLERFWLDRELNYQVADERLARLRGLDDPELIHELYKIGAMAAEKQVRVEHFVDRLHSPDLAPNEA